MLLRRPRLGSKLQKLHRENTLLYESVPNINQPGHICVLFHCKLIFTRLNSKWAKSIIFTSKEKLVETDEMMHVPFRKLKTIIFGITGRDNYVKKKLKARFTLDTFEEDSPIPKQSRSDY